MLTDPLLLYHEKSAQRSGTKMNGVSFETQGRRVKNLYPAIRRFYYKTIQRIRETEQQDARRSRDKDGKTIIRNVGRSSVSCVCWNALDPPLSTRPYSPFFFAWILRRSYGTEVRQKRRQVWLVPFDATRKIAICITLRHYNVCLFARQKARWSR